MFNVGDMVIANEKSDNCYLITNKQNQCVMIIKEVSSEDLVVVEVVHNKLSNVIGLEFPILVCYLEKKVYSKNPYYEKPLIYKKGQIVELDGVSFKILKLSTSTIVSTKTMDELITIRAECISMKPTRLSERVESVTLYHNNKNLVKIIKSID